LFASARKAGGSGHQKPGAQRPVAISYSTAPNQNILAPLSRTRDSRKSNSLAPQRVLQRQRALRQPVRPAILPLAFPERTPSAIFTFHRWLATPPRQPTATAGHAECGASAIYFAHSAATAALPLPRCRFAVQ